jgi:hypothetical protein
MSIENETLPVTELEPARRERGWWHAALLLFLSLQVGFLLGFHFGEAKAKLHAAPVEQSPTSGTAMGGAISVNVDPEAAAKWQATQEQMQRDEALRRQKLWDKRPVLAAPSDAPPASIRVGPYTYYIRWTSGQALGAQNALALTFPDKQEIWLNPKRGRDQLRIDLFHELSHCAGLISDSRGEQDDPEEEAIHEIATGWVLILRDNPELVRWMREAA